MITPFHIDIETRSKADLKKTGGFRYAEDPSTEIMCAAVARGEEEPLLWVNPKFEFDDMSVCKSSLGVMDLINEMNSSDAPVYAHNAYYEHALLNYGPKSPFKIDYRRWRCTAAMSRRAAIPPSLEKAAETLGLLQQKDSKGKALIRKFSIPQKASGKFIQPIDRQDDFIAFCDYCLQDVRVEQGIHKALKHFELTGDTLAAFQADLAINSRGLPVNLPALRHAQSLIEANEARLTEEFRQLTGGAEFATPWGSVSEEDKFWAEYHGQKAEKDPSSRNVQAAEDFAINPTQRDSLLAWLKERGYEGADLRASTIEEESKKYDPSSLLGRVLSIKKSLSFASIKKVKAMIECACADSRVRGTIQFYGAGPGRASGRLVQPQNFKRPTIKNTDDAYADIMAGASEEHIELFYGPLLEVIGSCIRHFIHDESGPIFDVDFSSIEARIAAWLAGEEWTLEVFRTHGKIYEATACRMSGMSLQEMLDYAKEHGKHHPDRQKGKVASLALQYQGGVEALKAMGALDMGLKEEELPDVVEQWREANPNIVKVWHAYDRAAKAAVSNFGSRHQAGKIEFFCAVTAGTKYLFAKLPSGRRLAYRDPKIEETVSRDKKTGKIETWDSGKVKTRQSLTYWGQIRGKTIWGRCGLYGGLLLQNFCEGVGADLLNNGIIKSEAAGYEVCSLIHDQILTYTRENQSIEELVGHMTNVPEWTKGLPVAADGQVQPYYTK